MIIVDVSHVTLSRADLGCTHSSSRGCTEGDLAAVLMHL